MTELETATPPVASLDTLQQEWQDLKLRVGQLEAGSNALEKENKALRFLLETIIEHRQKSHGELVMILWTRMPPGAPRTKPTDVRMKADEAHPGLVLTQDITVLAGLQRGLHQPGLTHLTLSNEERRVINMHRNLERYLELPESDRITGGETPDSTAAQNRR